MYPCLYEHFRPTNTGDIFRSKSIQMQFRGDGGVQVFSSAQTGAQRCNEYLNW